MFNLYINFEEKYTGLSRADLFKDEGIELQKKVLNDTGIDNTLKQFTKNFTIPATPTNNELLKHWEHKANESVVNPNKSINARIEIDSIYVIDGVIELLSVTWKLGKPESYDIVFYSDSSSLKALFGTTMLEDIDWSHFVFDFTQQNVVNSWLTSGSDYYVPVIAWKRWFKWYKLTSTDPNDISLQEYGVKMSELRVGLSLLKMIEVIGEHVGVSFVFDSKISAHLFDAFVIPSKFEDQALTLSQELFKTDVENSVPLVVENGAFTPPPTGNYVPVMDTVNSDPRNRWDGTNRYTAEFSGTYTFELSWIGNNKAKYDLFFYGDVEGEIAADNTGNVTDGSVQFVVPCVAGQTYYFAWYCDKNNIEATPQMNTVNVPISIYGLPYNPSRNMPVMKAIDFLSGFMKAFNLIAYKSDLNEYTITDTASLYDNYANRIDLTDYVNETSLTYKKLPVYDLINFKHKDNEVSPNLFYFDINGKQFAELYYIPDVDFSEGEMVNESIFSVFPPAYISVYDDKGGTAGRTDLWCHFQLSNDPEPKPVLANFLLMYRNDDTAISNTWYLQDGVGVDGEPTFSEQLTWGYYSQVQDVTSTVNSNTLSYSMENPFIGAVAQGTIINSFYLDWLVQLYKRTAYTLEIAFPIQFGVFLKVTEISIIYLNGFYHMVASWKYNSATSIITLKLLRYDSLIIEDKTEENGILKIDF